MTYFLPPIELWSKEPILAGANIIELPGGHQFQAGDVIDITASYPGSMMLDFTTRGIFRIASTRRSHITGEWISRSDIIRSGNILLRLLSRPSDLPQIDDEDEA